MPHLHIPLQSGSNRILKLMKRRYSSEYYTDKIIQIKNTIPNICIGVDVITGFPTETEKDFEKTYQLLKDLKVSYLHVFSYSKRFNTEASNIHSVISKKEIIYRRKLLQKLSNEKYQNYINNNIGVKSKVLFEKKED